MTDASSTKPVGALTRMLRDPNPLLIKELRTVLRTPLFIRFLYLATGVVALATLTLGASIASTAMVPADVGRVVFQLFFTLALAVIVVIGPAYAATTLTSEHEGRTYESLILTGMDPWRIVRGKFIACMGGMSLVLISFAPVVGIAFLFGGVSPVAVFFGFCALFLVMGPAVASGIAISSRRRRTRIAILIAVISAGGIGLPLFSILWAIGDGLKSRWSLTMEGPFWFTEALANRFFELDTFLLLVVIPIYLAVMLVWFMLASAVAGVRPTAEDRSGPFKLWSAVAIVGYALLSFALPWLASSSGDIGEFTTVLGMFSLPVATFFALLFANEPPLPPRQYQIDRASFPLWRVPFTLFGPGAAGTTRFAFVAIVTAVFASSACLIAARHLCSSGVHTRYDVAIGVLAIGHASVGVFTLTFAEWLRLVTRHAIAARIVAVAVMLVAYIAPVLLSLLADENAFNDLDEHVPVLFKLSPAFPDVIAVQLLDGRHGWLHRAPEVAIVVVVFGGLSLFFWLLIELRVRKVTRLVAARREERQRRARESMPPSFARSSGAADGEPEPSTPATAGNSDVGNAEERRPTPPKRDDDTGPLISTDLK